MINLLRRYTNLLFNASWCIFFLWRINNDFISISESRRAGMSSPVRPVFQNSSYDWPSMPARQKSHDPTGILYVGSLVFFVATLTVPVAEISLSTPNYVGPLLGIFALITGFIQLGEVELNFYSVVFVSSPFFMTAVPLALLLRRGGMRLVGLIPTTTAVLLTPWVVAIAAAYAPNCLIFRDTNITRLDGGFFVFALSQTLAAIACNIPNASSPPRPNGKRGFPVTPHRTSPRQLPPMQSEQKNGTSHLAFSMDQFDYDGN